MYLPCIQYHPKHSPPPSHLRNELAPQSTLPSLQSPTAESKTSRMVPENGAHVIQRLSRSVTICWAWSAADYGEEHGLCRRHVDDDQQCHSAYSVDGRLDDELGNRLVIQVWLRLRQYGTEGAPRRTRSAIPVFRATGKNRQVYFIEMSQYLLRQ